MSILSRFSFINSIALGLRPNVSQFILSGLVLNKLMALGCCDMSYQSILSISTQSRSFIINVTNYLSLYSSPLVL